MDRREFISHAVIAGVGLGVSTRSSFSYALPPRKVIVIGAGLSGLVAAYELNKRGYEINVLEAQARPGGRVFTLRSFSEGLWADAGAARIPANHDLTIKYAGSFDLKLIPFYPTENKFRRFNGGKGEDTDWAGFRDVTSMVMSLDKPDLWRKIDGGNDLLPKAFAKSLGSIIHYDSPVVKIAQDATRVTVSVRSKGSIKSLEADSLICAIPATTLADVDTAGAFSQAKIDTIKSTKYDSASRVFLETRRRFWQDDKLNGFGFGDEATEVWNSAFGQNGTHGILQTYLRGNYSLELTKMSEAERIEHTVAKLSLLFPALKTNLVGGISKCWSEDPWVKGAWGHVFGTAAAQLAASEGRIFFAGEHLSNNPSWMQGALESGLRAVDEVTRSVTAGVQSSTV